MVYTDGRYIIADSSRELQRFVADTHLPIEYLNSSSFFPHYRIDEKHVNAALSAGVKKVSSEELTEIAHRVYRYSS